MRQMALRDVGVAQVPDQARPVAAQGEELVRLAVEVLLGQQLPLDIDLRVGRQPRHVGHHAAVRKVYLRHGQRLHRWNLLLVLPTIAAVLLRPAATPRLSLVEGRHGFGDVPDYHLSVEAARGHQVLLTRARIETETEHLVRRLQHDLWVDQVDEVPQQDVRRVRLPTLLHPLVEGQVARRRDRDHALARGVPVDGGDRHVLRVFDVVVIAHLL
mmetsp:Transcript_83599/g.235886  ORF Transcript_83599/g.235886 Transcript_83599/m.235886 type:complete len:214 (-) Transcript_83599:2551-3192(-)